jgi:hypothetical protein
LVGRPEAVVGGITCARRIRITSGAVRVAKSPKPASWMYASSAEYTGRIIDPMSFDPMWLFLSLIPSGAGFVLFVYGRKQQRWVLMVAGIVFTVYPYFTETIAALVGVGVVLSVATWVAVRGGW